MHTTTITKADHAALENLWGDAGAWAADVTVLPTAVTRARRGFDPDSVRIDWKVS